MIAALALMAQAATAPAAAPLPPPNWSTLPSIRFVKPVIASPRLADFVRAKIRHRRCAAQRRTNTGWVLTIDVAVLVTPQGLVRRTVPRAIHCPSIEQYAAGLAFSRATGNIATEGLVTDAWYKTSMAFAWPG
ncbi:hypothetical protein [Sphingomonas oligophenolica]|uniref:TonB C-terminal domain-containing protein n=1 Tax=Sphingomonas oligophenolica TaxID=301154 RepID=A0A502CLT8_9SPHN|nr:hypothetical protein [Sphingomonas oligophenolica]TPG12736.1 hypothetical protein EAH84_08165 [Sphingomonas oligophenolica]